MSALGLLDVGPIEMLVLALAAIMLFGGDLPDIARRAGRIMGRLRGAANDLTRQFDAPPDLLHLPDPDAAMHRPAPPALPAGAPPAPSSSTAPASLPAPPAAPASGAAPEQPPPPPL